MTYTIDKLSVTREEVKRIVTFLHIGDCKFPAIEVRNLLEEMQDCDGMFNAMLIDNSELANALESIGAITGTGRGSYRRGNNYLETVDKLEQLLGIE